MKKITWPNAKDVLKGTGVTIFCIAIVGVAIFLVDLGLTSGIDGLRGVAEDMHTTTTTTTTAAAEKEEQSADLAAEVVGDSQSTTPAAN